MAVMTMSTIKYLERVLLSVFFLLLAYTIGLTIEHYFKQLFASSYTLFIFDKILIVWFTIDTFINKNAYNSGKIKRRRILCLFLFFMIVGIESSFLISYTLKIDSQIVVETGLGTCLLFIAFVIFPIRNLYFQLSSNVPVNLLGFIYNIGIFSMSIIALWLMIANYFLKWTYLQQLIHGILIIKFCLQITNNTHNIILSFESGNRDFLLHTLTLSLSCIRLFEEILLIQTCKRKRSKVKTVEVK